MDEEEERLLWQIQLDNERKEKENLITNILSTEPPVVVKASPSLSSSVSEAQAAAAARFQAYRQGEVRT